MKSILKSLIACLIISTLGGCAQDKSPTIPVKLSTIKVGKFPHSISLGSSQNQLFVSCFSQQQIVEVDLKQATIKQTFSVLEGPGQLVADPRVNRLFALHHKQNGFAVLQCRPAKLLRTAQTGRLNLAGGCARPGYNELWISNGQTKILVFTRGLALKKNITIGRFPQNIIFDQSGDWAYTSLKGENAVAVINTWTYRQEKKIDTGIFPRDLLIVGNKLCVSNYGSNDISIIDVNRGEELHRLPVKKRPNALAYHNNTLWVACEKSFYIMAINVTEGKVIGKIRTGFSPGDLLARKDGSLIVTSPRKDKIAIIYPQTTASVN